MFTAPFVLLGVASRYLCLYSSVSIDDLLMQSTSAPYSVVGGCTCPSRETEINSLTLVGGWSYKPELRYACSTYYSYAQ
ncbi:hypothetical protein BD414DRAFT_264012 [Trametes punicea]|nr:hypothetical protein BD414DRAFT_264012 [Trametes punicea]